MSADHNTLDALRRLANDRAATPAEKATARSLAKALVSKIGNRPRRGRRKGHGAALPEPPAARRRRLWIVWLEGALHKIEVAGWWLHGIWIVSIIMLGPLLVFGSDAVRQQVSDIYLVRKQNSDTHENHGTEVLQERLARWPRGRIMPWAYLDPSIS